MNSNFNKNNNRKNNNSPAFVTLPIVFTGVDKNGREYDVESCKKIIEDLQLSNVFSKLSVSLGIQKSLIEDGDSKGTFTIARIQSVDTETWDASLMLFTANKKYANDIKDFVIVPHVRTGRASNEVISILRFEIVQAMDA